MVELPTEGLTERAIYDLYESQSEPARAYLGGSQIGESCERFLFYSFRWAFSQKFEGRILRLFETGHREETRVIENLKAIGCTVHEKDANGDQFRYTDHAGHYSGGLDGVVLELPEAPKTWHLLEVKTHNKKSFAALKKHGVEKSKPKHFAQCQSYMRMAKLKRAVYIGICKDTDTIYVKRIKYEPKKSKAIHTKALRIIESKTPLEKISQDPDWFECKWCPAKDQCHGDQVADVNCRTCVHATPELDGKARWTCARYDCDIPEDNQRKGCENHLHIPELIPYATPIDAGDDWIKYQMADGREFVECARDGFPADKSSHYSSKELAAIHPNAIGNETVDAARNILGGEVIG
ncbi:hypothetical protein LCGC14_0424790 [marine sediment metagenome]|uniref:PD-(D/E)XK endonuclease-like domain-containing protein n=1 Tax=marine sediment metagenome TaxID=412755 RepID=A0A0F9T7W1_9ZZZZ